MARKIARHAAALFAGLVLSVSYAQATLIPFSITIVDFGTASGFNVIFSTPASFTGLVDVTAELHITVTDGSQDGASATGNTGVGSSWIFAGVGSPAADDFGVDLGPSCVAGAGQVATCDFSASNTMTWNPADIGMQAVIGFLGSGNDDRYAITGFLQVVEHVGTKVPEPTSLLLVVLGLAAAGAVRRRRINP